MMNTYLKKIPHQKYTDSFIPLFAGLRTHHEHQNLQNVHLPYHHLNNHVH